MTRDWRRIDGPVTACYDFEQRRFNSLVEALHYHDRHSSWGRPKVKWYYDEYGIVIPDWKVEEVYYANPRPRPHYKGWIPPHPYVHRQGPVSGLRRAWRGKCYRRISTQAERGQNVLLDYDEEALEHGIRARGSRRGHNLPSAWDDIQPSRQGNGWKRHRDKQWRGT